MIDKEKITNELAEAAELMNVSVDTDINSQQRSNREAELHSWNEEQARKIARDAGVELTDAHLQVVQLLRDYYLEHGSPQSGRELSDMLDNAFASQGGRKYLYQLCPDGPVTQGMHFAGLPVPANSEDGGFGTAR